MKMKRNADGFLALGFTLGLFAVFLGCIGLIYNMFTNIPYELYYQAIKIFLGLMGCAGLMALIGFTLHIIVKIKGE